MADWLTRTLETVAELVQLGLDKLEQRQATKASKRFAEAPVANRWINAWREQNGLPLEAAPLTTDAREDNTVGQSTLSDKEMDTLLASFYGAKVVAKSIKTAKVSNKLSKKDSPALTAKQRLLDNLAMPLDNMAVDTLSEDITCKPADDITGSNGYISRIATVVRAHKEPLTSSFNLSGKSVSESTLSKDTTSVSSSLMATIAAMPVLDKSGVAAVSISAGNQTKPFATLMEASADMAPNPFAHMVAKNQFLSDRINRLANQYFEEAAQDDETV